VLVVLGKYPQYGEEERECAIADGLTVMQRTIETVKEMAA
jgi:hypothetical protein